MSEVTGSHVPGTPAHIPVEPSIGRIVWSIILLVAAAWVALSYLPRHRPLSEAEAVGVIVRGVSQGDVEPVLRSRFTREQYVVWWIGILLIGVLGLKTLLAGLLWKNYSEARCRRCEQRVVAKKGQWGLSCPNENYTHYAVRYYGQIGIAVLLIALLAVMLLAALLAALR